mmetsp:Transcript_9803/g.22085  ORF Transcript_9803/g.22085 Transcript_9803/m.22085 type:complete len:379 (-) Transcript_9803:38-1174(-)|eukprot:CAMPEP_0172317576 /NCGR_PEP_ID=MMETSP1058-20130122/32055_1 /TAXON_ID=83371 /ORGANISM="Detonula confervacea, Strain CCMP 353" /LENGTH=378 /DNA_ID=CAMNT_0013032171 /DNA_START=149 /DNA_END=1285 /DNA_ORIENTATION=+
MAGIPQPSYGVLGTELILLFFQLPFGVVVGAVTERFSRCSHSHAKLRNIIINSMIAFASVSFILGHHTRLSWHASGGATPSHDGKSHERISVGMLMSLMTRIFIFVSGTVVGAALQPVGLTGGIATGKSTVSSLLQSPQNNADDENEKEIEFIIIDVDGIAHDILLPNKLANNESVYDRLVSEFGTDILVKDEGQDNDNNASPNIDRRKLGDLVFPDRHKRRKLNSITHPKIIKIMLKRILFEGLNLGRFSKQNPKSKSALRVVCVDIPLLFEGGLPMRMLFGTIIVVACKSTLQLERLHKRNPDLTLEQCRQRIASQIPVEEKARRAHVVIRNDESLKSLKSQVWQVKRQVARRGIIELPWLVIGFGGLLLTQYSIN